MRPATLLFLASAFLAATSVTAAETAPRPADVEFFEKKVRPLLVERCYGCHSAQAKKQKGGLLLDSRAALLKGGDSGPAVVPGKPDKSLLIQAVRYERRPTCRCRRRASCPTAQIAVLEEWVRRGAPLPRRRGEGAAKHGDRPRRGPQVLVVPAAADVAAARPCTTRAWPRRRIDAFLLAAMEKRGLRRRAPADRRVLIRRAYFDLIGLPPTPEEVDAFVDDTGPGRLRAAGRPAAGVAALRRALGPATGSTWPATATSPRRGPKPRASRTATATGWCRRSTTTCPTTSSCSGSWPPT